MRCYLAFSLACALAVLRPSAARVAPTYTGNFQYNCSDGTCPSTNSSVGNVGYGCCRSDSTGPHGWDGWGCPAACQGTIPTYQDKLGIKSCLCDCSNVKGAATRTCPRDYKYVCDGGGQADDNGCCRIQGAFDDDTNCPSCAAGALCFCTERTFFAPSCSCVNCSPPTPAPPTPTPTPATTQSPTPVPTPWPNTPNHEGPKPIVVFSAGFLGAALLVFIAHRIRRGYAQKQQLKRAADGISIPLHGTSVHLAGAQQNPLAEPPARGMSKELPSAEGR